MSFTYVKIINVLQFQHGNHEACLKLVDLAGAEGVGRAQSSGLQFTEGVNINKGLLSLGKVLAALSNSSAYVPYRYSFCYSFSLMNLFHSRLSVPSSWYSSLLTMLAYAVFHHAKPLSLGLLALPPCATNVASIGSFHLFHHLFIPHTCQLGITN